MTEAQEQTANHEKRITEIEKDLSKIPSRWDGLSGGGAGGGAGEVGGLPQVLKGDEALEGSSEDAARRDHQHAIAPGDASGAEPASFAYDAYSFPFGTGTKAGYMALEAGETESITHFLNVVGGVSP